MLGGRSDEPLAGVEVMLTDRVTGVTGTVAESRHQPLRQPSLLAPVDRQYRHASLPSPSARSRNQHSRPRSRAPSGSIHEIHHYSQEPLFSKSAKGTDF